MVLQAAAGTVLSPAAYDRAEDIGRRFVSNRLIQAFAPVTFEARGYPVRVTDDRELWRYVDVMHETRFERTVADLLGGLTAEEFATFHHATRFVRDLTLESFGRPYRCENALLRAMSVFRYLKALKPRTVVELGPGSGYLGLLLLLDGIGYIGIENAQAFYLFQNRLWRAAAPERLTELAGNDLSFRAVLSGDLSGKVVHVPWWKVVDLDLVSLPRQVDAATANHCLSEIHPNALKYYLRLTKILLRRPNGSFVFEGWGDDILHARGLAVREFLDARFVLAHSDHKVTAFVTDVQPGEEYGRFPVPVALKHRVRNVARRLTGADHYPYEFAFQSYSGANRISSLVRATQAHFKTAATIEYLELDKVIAEIYGLDIQNPEEKFLTLINVDYPT